MGPLGLTAMVPSHAEVGHALLIPEGTAHSRLHTARKRLAEALIPT